MGSSSSPGNGILPRTLYLLLFLGVFFFTLVNYLPYGAIETRCEHELSKLGLMTDIGGLAPAGMTTLTAENITFGSPAGEFKLTDVSVSLDLFSLLTGDVSLDIEGATLGGFAKATAELTGNPAVEAQWNGLSLVDAPLPPNLSSVQLQGVSTGNGTFSLVDGKLTSLSGRLGGTMRGLVLGPGKYGSVSVPRVDLGDGRFTVTANSGKLRFEELLFEGSDMGITGSGSVNLMNPIKRSPVSANVTLRPTATGQKKLPLLFSILNENRNPDGSYIVSLRGTLGTVGLRKR